MSHIQNDIINESLLDALRECNGAWYRDTETLEEAVAKSANANRLGSNRLGFAKALHFVEIAPNIFVKEQVEDTTDEDYQSEVDNKLSFGEDR